jgi:NADH-quinone oxidoreductase subunit G
MLADEMGTPINLPTVEAAAREMNSLGTWDGARATFTPANAGTVSGATILSSWRLLLDAGSLQDGEANLAKTAHPSVAVISADRAEKLGVKNGERITISASVGAITLPVEIADIDSKTVWIPRNSQSSRAIALLGAASGIEVSVVKA